MGQRAGLSFKDAKILNLRYCVITFAEVCSKKTNCSNGGYVDPNNCSRCRCPSGFGGLTCDQVKKSSNLILCVHLCINSNFTIFRFVSYKI
uniref:EGF-like domain-containing protein n=1 Tax=Syphacia muris TaxID=451379 RepID=A0A0N5AT53_9BILA